MMSEHFKRLKALTPRRVVALFGRAFVVGTMVVSRASASVLSSSPAAAVAPGVDWDAVRGELGKKPAESAISADIIDIVRATSLDGDLHSAIEVTYKIAKASEVTLLDQLWFDTLVMHGNSELISQFVAYRAVLKNVPSEAGNKFLDQWLWKTSGGDCDGAPVSG